MVWRAQWGFHAPSSGRWAHRPSRLARALGRPARWRGPGSVWASCRSKD